MKININTIEKNTIVVFDNVTRDIIRLIPNKTLIEAVNRAAWMKLNPGENFYIA